MIRRKIITLLLAALNSRWLNQTPCEFGFIGNVDAFSLANLESEEKQQPGITIKTILEDAARFRSCPMSHHGVTVIEGDETRKATAMDLHELRQSLKPRNP